MSAFGDVFGGVFATPTPVSLSSSAIRRILLRANHTVVVQSRATRRTASGATVDAGIVVVGTYTPVWVQPAHTNVVERYGAQNLTVTHRIYLDQAPDGVAPNNTVMFGTRKFTVRGVINEAELGRLWYIDCEED